MSNEHNRDQSNDRQDAMPLPELAARGMAAALNSQQLLRGQKVVAIEHNGELYRLQSTRAGKLILTK